MNNVVNTFVAAWCPKRSDIFLRFYIKSMIAVCYINTNIFLISEKRISNVIKKPSDA